MPLIHVQHERTCLRQEFDDRFPSQCASLLTQLDYPASIGRINSGYSRHLLLYPFILLTLTLAALGPILVGAGLHQHNTTGHNTIGLDAEMGIVMLLVGLTASALLAYASQRLQRRLLMQVVQQENALRPASIEGEARSASQWRVAADGVMLGDDGLPSADDEGWLQTLQQWDELRGLRRMKLGEGERQQLRGYHLFLDVGPALAALNAASIEVTQPSLPSALDVNSVFCPRSWCLHCRGDSPLCHSSHSPFLPHLPTSSPAHANPSSDGSRGPRNDAVNVDIPSALSGIHPPPFGVLRPTDGIRFPPSFSPLAAASCSLHHSSPASQQPITLSTPPVPQQPPPTRLPLPRDQMESEAAAAAERVRSE